MERLWFAVGAEISPPLAPCSPVRRVAYGAAPFELDTGEVQMCLLLEVADAVVTCDLEARECTLAGLQLGFIAGERFAGLRQCGRIKPARATRRSGAQEGSVGTGDELSADPTVTRACWRERTTP